MGLQTIFCDNKSVVDSICQPESLLKNGRYLLRTTSAVKVLR